MEADLLQEAEELLRDIWQQHGCVWPGPQVPPPDTHRICAYCRRNRDMTELTCMAEIPCQCC